MPSSSEMEKVKKLGQLFETNVFFSYLSFQNYFLISHQYKKGMFYSPQNYTEVSNLQVENVNNTWNLLQNNM